VACIRLLFALAFFTDVLSMFSSACRMQAQFVSRTVAMNMHSPSIEMLPIGALRPYSGNARTHSRRQIRQIADSIRRFGLRTTVLPSLQERIEEISADADLDEEPDNHFKKLLDVLERVEALGVDSGAATLIEDARDQVRRSVDEIEERKRECNEGMESETDWTHIVTQKKEDATVAAVPPTNRSIFDDVDK
jgi:DNA-binding PucR family transcriptional regulator